MPSPMNELMDDPRSDNELLAASRADPQAFAVLYTRYFGPIAVYFRRRTGDMEVAADLTAETFAAALESRHRFDPGQGSAAGWLFTIASRKLADSWRQGQVEDRARRKLAMDPVRLDNDSLEELERELDAWGQGQLQRLYEQLPPQQREAVSARVLQERDYREIAHSLRLSESVVRQRVSRGLRALRIGLGGEPT